MPRVIDVEGYQVMVYTRDEHPPAHVHVEKNGCKIKVLLHDDAAEYHSYKGVQPNEREIRRATAIVAEHLTDCWTAWRTYHA
jgi:Domain of unknown function (DUF4160)